jgi:hypothetical protein
LPPGFMAGGPLEGETCYTVIHYANEAESAICGLPEGTPIDTFWIVTKRILLLLY